MAAALPGQVSAVQVGTFLLEKYYHVIQEQPEVGYQFYNDASSMMRIDGDASETAATMMQIHSLIISLDFTGIEIKTAHCMNSWDGGILVVVTGFVQTSAYSARRKFVQTFFLAPQEKGYFVLNDIFQFIDEDIVLQNPAAALAHQNLENNLSQSNQVHEAVPDFMVGGDLQGSELVSEVQAEDNETVDPYQVPDSELQNPHFDGRIDETPAEGPVGSFENTTNILHDPSPSLPEDHHVGEPPKHTYASILRSSKAQSGNSLPQSVPLRSPSPVATEWQQAPQATQQVSKGPDKSALEAVEDIASYEDDVEPKSVYVGNLHPSISEADLEREFRNYGRIRPDGVAIRSRKDTGSYYAFVEFEEPSGVQNAFQASPIILNGREIYVEERRPNSGTYRGGRRGRGRGGYQSDAPHGRSVGRVYGRGNAQDNERDYNRLKGNGFYQRGSRHGTSGNQVTRNGYHTSSEAAN